MLSALPAFIRLPSNLTSGSASSHLDLLVFHLERRAQAKDGVEMRAIRKPLAAIMQQQKKPLNAGKKYRGVLLGVDDSTHSIKDLPLSKRELSYLSLLEALKKNIAECSTTGTDVSPPLSHTATTICAALEYESFIKHHTATAYLGSMRTALGEIRSATMRKQR